MRKSHAKIQSHPLLGVLLAEAAQGVKGGGCAGRAQLGAKTAGARIHRGHIEDPLVVRLHQAGSAGEQALPGSQGNSSSRSPRQRPAGGKPRGAYGATAASAAHKMGYRPRDVAALGRSVADAGDRVASASGLARLPHQRMWSSSRGGDPARGEMIVQPTLRTQAPRRWFGLRGAARRASPQRDAERAEDLKKKQNAAEAGMATSARTRAASRAPKTCRELFLQTPSLRAKSASRCLPLHPGLVSWGYQPRASSARTTRPPAEPYPCGS